MTKVGSRKLHIFPKVTKMGLGALRGQRHIPSKNLPKYPPGGGFPVRSFCYPVLSFLLSTPIICKLGVTQAVSFPIRIFDSFPVT